MGNKLVIVESPAKARTISNILGKEYNLMASMGHVRDLPANQMGVDINNKFKPKYVASRSKTLTSLKQAAQKADEIFLATDPDREGEAIAWHLKEELSKKSKAPFSRVEFHEITRSAINKAFSSPRQIDEDLVNSQQARRILDRLVGYQVSPLLWSRIRRNISAGRVQSVALRIICEREREILNFVPKEYWNFSADFLWKADPLNLYSGKLFSINGKKTEIPNQEIADKILDAIDNKKSCAVSDTKKEIVQRRAPAPFITSTLQQSAGTYLRFTANRTMQIAQQLYEGIELEGGNTIGLITYMRTDSFTLSQEAINKGRSFIEDTFGKEYLPDKPNYFKNKSNAQEAHEAIRPTNVFKTPEALKNYLNKEQYNLYSLIWKRFVACQMAPAKNSRTTIDTNITGSDNASYIFRTVSTVNIFPGFEKVLRPEKGNQDSGPKFLNDIKVDDISSVDKIDREQKFTEPPPRFTEPSLIKELEANGIGRPSTYAAIINTILKRQYTEKEKGKLKPTELGFDVNDYLVKFLEKLFNIGFTAEMESKLDQVEEGKEEWTSMLQKFYDQFLAWLEQAKYTEAPDENKVSALFNELEKISEWEVPEKKTKGSRTKGDKAFMESLKKQFDKNGKLSKKQWDSLIKLSLKYTKQLPELSKLAEMHSFLEDLKVIEAEVSEQKRRTEEKLKENSKTTEQMVSAISALSKEDIDNFAFNTSYRFNEGTFFKSLLKRADQGAPFSDKQKNVFCRIIMNNKDNISNFSEILEKLNITEEAFNKENSTNTPENSEQAKEIETLLAKFDNFEKWAEPEKKGKRTIDDKNFYNSLKNQFGTKKRLSPKQVFALKKLVNKYFEA